jgi:hypothetical protein
MCTPGYWAWDPDANDYYWVPGTWVEAPEPGFLWTPGYWGWGDGVYLWHGGYWGAEVGFYGGVCYGFGYGGFGYGGGYWRNGAFFYNRSVNNFGDVHITNVYNKTVINNHNSVSYNGGRGGTTARATAQEEAAARGRHIEPTSAQVQHQHAASTNRDLHASVNHGKPAIAATSKPGEFSGKGVVAAKSAPVYHPVAASKTGTAAAGRKAGGGNTPGSSTKQPTHSTEMRKAGGSSETAPKSKTAAPARKAGGGEMTPKSSTAAPARKAGGGEMTPKSTESRKAPASTPPAHHNAPAAKSTPPPAHHNAPPARSAPPAQRSAPPAQHHSAPPAQHSAPPAQHHSAPPPAQHSAPPAKGKQPPK